MLYFVTRNIQTILSRLPETSNPDGFSCLFCPCRGSIRQQAFCIGMSNEGSCWALWRYVKDYHCSHSPTVVTETTGERAERAYGFNCDIKVLPKAKIDLETTLWEGRSSVLAGYHKCSLDPGFWFIICWQSIWSLLYRYQKKSKKIWNFVHNSFLPCPVNFITRCSICL